MASDKNDVWIYSWSEPKLWIFDASIILLFPLFLLILVLAEMGVWVLVRPFTIILVLGLIFEVYVAVALRVSIATSMRIIKMRLLGRRRPANTALFEAYVYDPHGMAGWRARLYAKNSGDE